MQINLRSDTVTYILTEEEQLQGALLTSAQQAVLQNERVNILKQLAYLTPSTMSEEGKESYWQQEAYLRGQLDFITHTLDKADIAQGQLG